MNGQGKSDGAVVPANPPNKAASVAAEAGEGRGPAKGNTSSKTRPGHRAGSGAPSALARVRRVAQQDTDARFTALLHHLTVDRLREAYRAISPTAAPGVEGVSWEAYGQELEANLRDLHARVHSVRLPGVALTEGVHSEDGRAVAAARNRRVGRQDRPTGTRRGAKRRLRGRLPGVFLWVPAGARPA